MPRPDPVPPRRGPDYERAASAWLRYKRMMKWMALAAIIAAALAIFFLWATGETLRAHMVIATAAGVGFTVLIGTALMGLVFLSSSSGHDEAATRGEWNDEDQA